MSLQSLYYGQAVPETIPCEIEDKSVTGVNVTVKLIQNGDTYVEVEGKINDAESGISKIELDNEEYPYILYLQITDNEGNVAH